MRLLGYSDRWSAQPGETIRFYVSSQIPRYRADLVRLIHGDENPKGPGFKETLVPHRIAGEYPGSVQSVHAGSYAVIDPFPALPAFTVQVWVWPTRTEAGVQGILSRLSADAESGFGLFVGADGALQLWLGSPGQPTVRVSSGRALRPREWTFVAASYDSKMAIVTQALLRFEPQRPTETRHESSVSLADISGTDVPFLIGAAWLRADGSRRFAEHVFNGKIGTPRVFDRALAPAQIGALMSEPADEALTASAVAAWDLTQEAASTQVIDIGPNGYHGTTVNRPMRGVTGHNWRGDALHFADAPDTYNAIYVHDDDVSDAGWEVSHEFTVTGDLASGVYALRLAAEGAEDHIPFVVRPPTGRPGADIALVLPTLSYMAYANESVDIGRYVAMAPHVDMSLQPAAYAYLGANSLKSTYDVHSDGSGVCFSSLLRPVLNFRPKWRKRLIGAPNQFPADLHLVDWLEAKGFAVDVFTDHDLHREGADLLSSYRVVLTGSHPEYSTLPMLQGLRDYLEGGGRLMYLGGNGFYCVTALDESGTLVEVRRWGGTRTWEAAPGEWNLSLTGEPGGIWRHRGFAPQALVGVGFSAQGFDRGTAYVRTPESFDPRVAFIFEGVGSDEIGGVPALILNHGAAGYEVDRAEPGLGTPVNTMVLATSKTFSDSYQFVLEEAGDSNPWSGGLSEPRVRADMAYLEYPNGGAVFSVGSISYCSTLSQNGYDNDISRITENVLRGFTDG